MKRERIRLNWWYFWHIKVADAVGVLTDMLPGLLAAVAIALAAVAIMLATR